MPAGPSEVFVASNNINNSELIAADLLSQLEHGNDSKAVLCSSSNELIDFVKKDIAHQVNSLSRLSILKESIKNISYIYAKDTDKMISVINESAPEHLILMDDSYVNMIPYINNVLRRFARTPYPLNHLEIMHLVQIMSFQQMERQRYIQD